MTSLPDGVFSHLSQFKELNLGHNRIRSITAGSFTGLEALEELNLHGNDISSLAAGVFSHLSQCKKLIMNRNRITSITAGSFTGLEALEELDTSQNNITSLASGIFDPLHFIRKIYLWGNRLTTLSPDLFINLPRPLVLYLSFYQEGGNSGQWDCSSLCWLKHEEQHGTVTFQESYGSYHPRCADGGDWSSLQCGGAGELSSSWCKVTRTTEKSSTKLPERVTSQKEGSSPLSEFLLI